MPSLFISYSRRDIEIARKLTKSFQGQDLDYWIDWEGIPPTVDWWKEIQKGIEEADVFLFLISPDSAASKVCSQEIKHAASNGKRLIPVVVRDVKAADVPTELGALNWIFLRESDDFNAGFEKLITAIRTDYDWVQTQRELQVKALEWERGDHDNSNLLRGRELQTAEFQLEANKSKEPYPTELQREYVLKSRQASNLQKRITASIAVVGIAILVALTIFSFIQAELANTSAKKEQAASTLAVANANTAEANAREAERQLKIALSRQLVLQAQSLSDGGTSRNIGSVLLAIQSMKKHPNADSSAILSGSIVAKFMGATDYDHWVSAIALSHNEKWMASAGCDELASESWGCGKSSAHVLEVSTGKEIAYFTQNGNITSVAFDPQDQYLVVGGCDAVDPSRSLCTNGNISVIDVSSGREITSFDQGNMVTSVAVAPNGRNIASGSMSGMIVLWNVDTGQEIFHVQQDDYVASVRFSSSGKYLTSSSDNELPRGGGYFKYFRIWDATTGKRIDDFRTTGAISQDEQYAVGMTGQDTAHIIELSTGKEIARLVTPDSCCDLDPILSFSPDNKYALWYDALTHTSIVWDARMGTELFRLDSLEAATPTGFSRDGKFLLSISSQGIAIHDVNENWVLATTPPNYINHFSNAVYSPDGKRVLSAESDGTIRLWDLNFDSEDTIINEGPVSGMILSQDGKYLIAMSGYNDRYQSFPTNGRNGSARVWRIGENGRLVISDASAGSLELSPNGEYVFSKYGGNGLVRDTATGNVVAKIQTKYEKLIAARFSPDSSQILVGGCDKTNSDTHDCTQGSARVWDITTSREISRLLVDGPVNFVAYSSDGSNAFSGNSQMLVIWDPETGKESKHIRQEGSENDLVRISSDGKYAIFSQDKDLTIWDMTLGKIVRRLTYEYDIKALEVSPNGKYLVSTDGSTVIIWDLGADSQVTKINQLSYVNAIAFSRDGTYVLGLSDCAVFDQTAQKCKRADIYLWKTIDGEEVANMSHADWMSTAISSDSFSPDGKYIVLGVNCLVLPCPSAESWVWELATEQVVARIVHGFSYSSFSPDSKYIISSSPYGAIIRQQWRPEDLIASACASVFRNLTRIEWQQYIGNSLAYQAVCPKLPIEPDSTSPHK